MEPLCEITLMEPSLCVIFGANVVSKLFSVFITPTQLGPNTRIPALLAIVNISFSNSIFSGIPVSLKPEAIIIAAFTSPLCSACLNTSRTPLAGIIISIKSTSSLISNNESYAFLPNIISSLGFTKYTLPWKPNRIILFATWYPALLGLFDAPIIAILLG